MQTTVTIQSEAVPIVKSGLEMKHKALAYNLRQYRQRLADLEQTYQMSSVQFSERFQTGQLGDDPAWFEWEFVLDALTETERQLKLLDSVNL